MVRKRRTLLYTLPIGIVIGVCVIVGSLEWRRSRLIAELTMQVASADINEATAAVERLSAIANPPLAVLVEVAATKRLAVAQAAQSAIKRLLDDWERQVEVQSRTGRVVARVAELASQLAQHRYTFAARDYPWLASTAQDIVRVANRCRGTKMPLIARHCDEVAAVVGTNFQRKPAGVTTSSQELEPKSAARPDDRAAGSSIARLERAFAEFPARPLNTPAYETQHPSATDGTLPSVMNSTGGGAVAEPIPLADAFSTPAMESAAPPDAVRGGAAIGARPPAEGLNTDSAWSMPVMRMVPAKTASSIPQAATDDTAREPTMAGVPPVAAEVRTQELLKRWQAGDEAQREEVERLLAKRGLKRLPPQIVEQCVSDDLQQRLQLADQVMKIPGLDGRPWLMVLAEDENAEVRLAAVTLMMTSDDSGLIEKAWEVSIHDRDPRIADLATRLRDRRMGTVRR